MLSVAVPYFDILLKKTNYKIFLFKVRFSGIPNNGTLELVELSPEEIGREEKVTLN